MSQLISEYEIPTEKPFLSCLSAAIGQMKMLDELLSKVPCSSKILQCCVSILQTIVFKWQHERCVCTPELGYWRKDLVMRFGICPTACLRKKHSSVRGWGGGTSLPQEQMGVIYHKITRGVSTFCFPDSEDKAWVIPCRKPSHGAQYLSGIKRLSKCLLNWIGQAFSPPWTLVSSSQNRHSINLPPVDCGQFIHFWRVTSMPNLWHLLLPVKCSSKSSWSSAWEFPSSKINPLCRFEKADR